MGKPHLRRAQPVAHRAEAKKSLAPPKDFALYLDSALSKLLDISRDSNQY